MQIQKKGKSKSLIAVTALLATLIVAALLYIYSFNRTPGAEINTSGPSVSDEIKAQGKNDKNQNSSAGLPEKSNSSTTDEVPSDPQLSVSIVTTDQANGLVTASANTSQATGTCVFLYSTPQDKPVTRQVGVNDSHCSVSIPQNEFSYIGQWTLKVTYYSDGKKTEVEKSVTIQ